MPRTFVTDLFNSLPGLPQPSVGATSVHTSSNPLNSAPEAAKKQLLTLHVLFPNEFLPALDLLDRRLVTRFRIRRNPNTIEGAMQQEGRVAPSTSVSTGLRGIDADKDAIEVEAAQAINDEAQRETPSAPNDVTAAGQKDSPDVEMQDAGSVEVSEELTRLPRIADQESRMQEETETGGLAAQHHDTDTLYYVRSAQQRSSRFNTSYESTTFYEVRMNAWNCSCPAFTFSSFPSVHPEPPVPQFEPDDKLPENGDTRRSFGGFSPGKAMPPVCKHLLACVLVERCDMFKSFVEEKDISVEEAAGWAAGWGD